MRVFKVSNSAGASVYVEATSGKAAIAYIAAKHYTVSSVTSSDVLKLWKEGANVESAPAMRVKPVAKPAAAPAKAA